MKGRLGRQSIQRDAARLKVLVGGGGTVATPTDHGALTGLDDDDHSQYVHISTARTITAQHAFSPAIERAPFTLGANAQDQTVTGLDADSVDGYDLSGAAGRVAEWGAGILTAASLAKSGTGVLTLSAGTAATLTVTRTGTATMNAGGSINYLAEYGPNADSVRASSLIKGGAGVLTLTSGASTGTVTFAAFGTAAIGAGALSVSSSANVGTAAHTHAVTSSSNPGAAAALLATDADGLLTLADLTITADLTTSRVDGHLIPKTVDTYDLGASDLLWRKGWLSELEAVLFVENTIQLLGGWFWIPKDAGVLAADCGTANNSVNFGKAMTPNDFVVFRNSGSVEYMKVVANTTGFIYTVTRDLDGSGRNGWVKGSPYAVLGNSGDGRIELNAYDTPRIQIITQGTVYNQQTEVVRLGDLNGNWGYTGTAYGIGIGNYDTGRANLTYDTTNGLRIRSGATDRITMNGGTLAVRDSGGSAVFTFNDDSGAEFTKPLTLGTAGGIYQGSGSFASPGTGLKIWNDSGRGRIAGYNGGVEQWSANTDGKLYAGNGVLKIDRAGITAYTQQTILDEAAYKFVVGTVTTAGLFHENDHNHNNMLTLICNRESIGFPGHIQIAAYGDLYPYIQIGAGSATFDEFLLLLGGTILATATTTAMRSVVQVQHMDGATPDSILQINPISATQVRLDWQGAGSGGEADLDFNVLTADGDDNGFIRLFRSTNTSGTVGMRIYKGNNSDTIQHSLRANGNSYLCVDSGYVGIGKSTTPASMLDVNGTITATAGTVTGGFLAGGTITAAAGTVTGNFLAANNLVCGGSVSTNGGTNYYELGAFVSHVELDPQSIGYLVVTVDGTNYQLLCRKAF